MDGAIDGLRTAAAVAATVAFAAMCAVDISGWRRTSPVRHGRAGLPAGPPTGVRTSSPSTWLAATAGAFVLAWGAASVQRASALDAASAVAGGFVAVSGTRSRVVALGMTGQALLVRRALRPLAVVAWSRLRTIDPPATPVGGWRFRTDGEAVTLMPSDLLGNEDALGIAISRAGLRFDGRRWTRPH